MKNELSVCLGMETDTREGALDGFLAFLIALFKARTTGLYEHHFYLVIFLYFMECNLFWKINFPHT